MLVNMGTSTPRPRRTRDLRRQGREDARRLAEQMTLPQPFDIDVFVKMVADVRGRPIILHPGASSADPRAACGLWILRDDHDLIVIHPQASAPHREHIVLHELGHMMCNHITVESPFDENSLFQGFLTGSGALAKMLARTSYKTPAEREAETFATVLGSRITAMQSAPQNRAPHREVNDESLERLLTALSKTRPPRKN